MIKHRGPTGLTTRPDSPIRIGQRCGRLTVIGVPFMLAKRSGRVETFAVCECECGSISVFRGHSISHGAIRSCGCDKGDNRKHGESGTRLHSIWSGMKTRCVNPNGPAWKYYGGRGIKVCQEWSASYEAFRQWAITNGYRPTLELDRRNVNGNYEPGNCRWANRFQQAANMRKRRDAKTSNYKGVSWCANLGKWRTQIQNNNKHIHIGVYQNEEDAAKAYDEAARRLHGEFAAINFPRKESASY